jgi:phage gp36-like protein
MSYATLDDFVTAFGDEETIALSNLDEPNSMVLNEPVIQRRLDDATAEIDSYLQAAGYALPLTSVPVVLRNRCCDIARYYLDRIRMREDVQQRYKESISYLKDVVNGKALLGLTQNNQVSVTAPDAPEWFSGDRVFTMDSLRGY